MVIIDQDTKIRGTFPFRHFRMDLIDSQRFRERVTGNDDERVKIADDLVCGQMIFLSYHCIIDTRIVKIPHDLVHDKRGRTEPFVCERVLFKFGMTAICAAVTSGLIDELRISSGKDLMGNVLYNTAVQTQSFPADRTEEIFLLEADRTDYGRILIGSS